MNGKVDWLGMKEVWVGYNVGCTMGFFLAHSAWQIDQFPTCWPMNGLFVHWSRVWGVLSFSERLVPYGNVNIEGNIQSHAVVLLMMSLWLKWLHFTQFAIQFLHKASFDLWVYCRCLYVCLSMSINSELVHLITHHLFKLGSPNLDHRGKRAWLRSLFTEERLTMTFQVKFNLKV